MQVYIRCCIIYAVANNYNDHSIHFHTGETVHRVNIRQLDQMEQSR